MKRVHIFGCSFNADYKKDNRVFPLCKDYIEAEEELGNKEIQSVSYWYEFLFKESGEEVVVYNYAAGGNSNDQIFHDFSKQSKRIRPKDYVIFQTTFATRVRAVNLLGKKWVNFQPPVGEEAGEFLNTYTTYTPDTLNKLCLERASTTYLEYLNDLIHLARRYCNLSNAYFCSLSLDSDLFRLDNSVDIPNLYGKKGIEKISDKFPHINDSHLTYQGIKSVVQEVINYFNTLSQNYVSEALLPEDQIMNRLEGPRPE